MLSLAPEKVVDVGRVKYAEPLTLKDSLSQNNQAIHIFHQHLQLRRGYAVYLGLESNKKGFKSHWNITWINKC